MTQPQVREGFRRIGMVLGWAAAILAIPAVISVTEPLSRSGSWWPTAKWGAIVIPAAYWCGATVARKAGWVIAGFFRPAPELERRKSFLESAKEEALKEF